MAWLGGALTGFGTLIILVGLFNSGFGEAGKKNLATAEKCVAVGDCLPERIIPTYSTGTLSLYKKYTEKRPLIFKIAGKIALFNTEDCYAPKVWHLDDDHVAMTWSYDLLTTYIESNPGEIVLVKVWIERDWSCVLD